MKRWIPGLIIVAGVLAVAGVVASKAATSHASSVDGGTSLTTQGEGQASDGVAYIGIALTHLSEEQAADAGLDGGALIARVSDSGPADGLLLEGDIVLAVGGQAVAGPGEVVKIVQSFLPDDVVTFTVHRDGASLDVDVTAGERQAPALVFRRSGGPRIMHLGASHAYGSKNLIKSEVKVETEEGVQTTRTAVGTIESLDVDAGTFSLALKDGSETIDYEIDDETQVTTSHSGELAGHNTDDLTTVVDVRNGDGDWLVISVLQGTHGNYSAFGSGPIPPRHYSPFEGFGGRPPKTEFRFFHGMPGGAEGFHKFRSPDDTGELFESLPDDVRKRFEEFHMGPDYPATTEDDFIVEGTQS